MKKLITGLLIFILFFSVAPVFARAILEINPNVSSVELDASGSASITYTVTNNTRHTINQISITPAYQTSGNPGSIGLQNDNCSSSGVPAGGSCTFQVTLSGQGQSQANFTLRPRVCGYNGTFCSVAPAAAVVAVHVTPGSTATLSSIAITPSSASIALFGTQQFTATGTYSDGSTQTITTSVTWNSSAAAATISSSGLATSQSVGSTNITASLDGITSNSVSLTVTALRMYITDGAPTNTVTRCDVTVLGTLSGCADAGAGGAVSNPRDIRINSAGTYAYIANLNANNVLFCPLDASGNITSPCTDADTGGINSFFRPYGIAFNSAGDLAYVTNFGVGSGLTSYCPILGDNSFGTCGSTGPSMTNPRGIAINPSNTYAYLVSQATSEVFTCPINSDGTFGVCTSLSGFNGPLGIAINSAGTFAYITSNTGGNVIKCDIDSTTAALSNCAPTGSGFTNPAGIALTSSLAFISDIGDGNIYSCVIDSTTGALSACGSLASGFTAPYGIGLH